MNKKRKDSKKGDILLFTLYYYIMYYEARKFKVRIEWGMKANCFITINLMNSMNKKRKDSIKGETL